MPPGNPQPPLLPSLLLQPTVAAGAVGAATPDSLYAFLELEEECQEQQQYQHEHQQQQQYQHEHQQQQQQHDSIKTTAVQHSVQRLSTSLGRHELVVQRLKQQLALSVNTHELQLTKELQDAIKQAAITTAAGAAAGAAAAAALGAGAAVAAAEHALANASARASLAGSLNGGAYSFNGSPGSRAPSSGRGGQLGASRGCSSLGGLVTGAADAAELVHLRAAAAQTDQLRQQLQAAEAKLAMHRTAAATAKDKMLQVEEFLQALELQHQQQQARVEQQQQQLEMKEQQLGHKDEQLQGLLQQLQKHELQHWTQLAAGASQSGDSKAEQQQQDKEAEGQQEEEVREVEQQESAVSPKHAVMDALEQHVLHMSRQAEMRLKHLQEQQQQLQQQQGEVASLLQQREELARKQQELELKEQQLSQRQEALQAEQQRLTAEQEAWQQQQQEAWQQQHQQQHELLVVQQSLGLLQEQLSFTGSQSAQQESGPNQPPPLLQQASQALLMAQLLQQHSPASVALLSPEGSSRHSLVMQVAETLSSNSSGRGGSCCFSTMGSREDSRQALLPLPLQPPAAADDGPAGAAADDSSEADDYEGDAEPRCSDHSATVLQQTESYEGSEQQQQQPAQRHDALFIDAQGSESEEQQQDMDGGQPQHGCKPLHVATAAAAADDTRNWQLVVSPRVLSSIPSPSPKAQHTGRIRSPMGQQQQQEPASGGASPTAEGSSDSLALAVSPRMSPPGHNNDHQQQQQQIGRLLECLRAALADNTVLCCECQHLQQLLVEERGSARASCRAVSLQLAAEVVRLSAQLQAAAVELQLQQTVANAAATAELEAVAEAARAAVTPIVDTYQDEIQGFLQELQQQLAACGCTAGLSADAQDADEVWQHELQQQLTDIEQTFGEDSSWLDPEAAAAVVAAAEAEAALPAGAADNRAAKMAAGSPANNPFVESPSGHVTPLMQSRRTTAVSMAAGSSSGRGGPGAGLLRRRTKLAETLNEFCDQAGDVPTDAAAETGAAGAPAAAATVAHAAASSCYRSSIPLLPDGCCTAEDTCWLDGSVSSSTWSMTQQHLVAAAGQQQPAATSDGDDHKRPRPRGATLHVLEAAAAAMDQQQAAAERPAGRHSITVGGEGCDPRMSFEEAAGHGCVSLSEPGTAPAAAAGTDSRTADEPGSSVAGREVPAAAVQLVEALQATVAAVLQRH